MSWWRISLFVWSWGLLLHAAQAQPPPAKPLLGSGLTGVELHENGARARFDRSTGHPRLVLNAERSDGWPGARLIPATVWDLSAADFLETEVRNRSNLPVKVVLSINDPRSDGQTHCSAAAIRIEPGDRMTLVVALGTWHNQPRPFDSSRATSLDVLFEKPKGPAEIVVGPFFVGQWDRRGLDELRHTPFFRQLEPPFGRGINLGNALDAPREGAWGFRLEADYFRTIRQAGFDFVRLPIRWAAHAADRPPYAIQEPFFYRVDWAIRQALQNDLRILIDMHHYDALNDDPAAEAERFVGIWSQIARRYADQPDEVAFELLNEPHAKMSAAVWQELAVRALKTIRQSNPDRTVVIGPVDWNGVDALTRLELPKDPHLVATFHYYAPFRFTHQGATWVGEEAETWLGTRWEATEAERAAVIEDLDKALRWSVDHACPVLLGEFGAVKHADLESRARWARFVAEEAAKRKFGYAWWAFTAEFDAYDLRQKAWIEPLHEALIPNRKRLPHR